jgi:regulator of protease activity HflC (stomatin/prohibitin superfamily)
MGGFSFMLGLVALAIVFLFMGVTVVRQGYVYTIERFGRYTNRALTSLCPSSIGSVARSI